MVPCGILKLYWNTFMRCSPVDMLLWLHYTMQEFIVYVMNSCLILVNIQPAFCMHADSHSVACIAYLINEVLQLLFNNIVCVLHFIVQLTLNTTHPHAWKHFKLIGQNNYDLSKFMSTLTANYSKVLYLTCQ